MQGFLIYLEPGTTLAVSWILWIWYICLHAKDIYIYIWCQIIYAIMIYLMIVIVFFSSGLLPDLEYAILDEWYQWINQTQDVHVDLYGKDDWDIWVMFMWTSMVKMTEIFEWYWLVFHLSFHASSFLISYYKFRTSLQVVHFKIVSKCFV